MILTPKSIEGRGIISPFSPRTTHRGMTYGCGNASYDIRLAEDVTLERGYTTLAFSMEHFTIPNDVCASVKDKSSWARKGVDVKNTFIDPGWIGYLTLEIGYAPVRYTNTYREACVPETLTIPAGSPIAQIVFERLEEEVRGYQGKYQNQGYEVVVAVDEG